MPPSLRRTRRDATGAPLDASAVYEPVQPYASGQGVYNVASRLRGDHSAVKAAPGLWMPEAADPDLKRRLRSGAIYDAPREPKPTRVSIPADRQVIAVTDALTGDGEYVRKGRVYAIDSPVVTANPELFAHPPRPLEAA